MDDPPTHNDKANSGAAVVPMALSRPKKTYPLMSRESIEALIASGRAIIIVNNYVLKVDGWINYHPGGDLSIRHMIGRDATDEVNALHSPEAKALMHRYRIGRIEGQWKNFVPPIQGGVFGQTDALSSPPRAIPASNSRPRVESSSSSSSVSCAPSPTFDTRESSWCNGLPDAVSLRSRSSLSVSTADESEMDSTTYLDYETRKQISLDLEKYPSLDIETQTNITEKYRLLGDEIRARGLYDCNYSAYAIELSRYTLLASMALVCVHFGQYALGGLFLGLFWHQLAFTAHDAGHMGITHNFTIDTLIGIFIADFCGGLSLGWWKWSHNVHHIVTNLPEHDPDNQHLPFFAVSHRFFESLHSTYHHRTMEYDWLARRLTSVQAYLYYPILTLGRFNLYIQSWIYVFGGVGPKKGPAWWHRWAEVVGMLVFWTWYGYFLVYKSIPTAWGRFTFVMISHMVTVPLHVQITLSHFAMSTTYLGPDESFPQRMLRTTMDVDCPQWLDFFHGGLQFQAIHHLYPRIPRHNLRTTQKLVQQFCNEVGIPYALYGFLDGNKEVIGHLAEVSRQGAILAKCQQTLAARGEHFHHH